MKKKNSHYQRWSRRDDTILIAGLVVGTPRAVLAKQLGRSMIAIRFRKWNYRMVLAKLECRDVNVQWELENDQVMMRMLGRGATKGEVANKLNCTCSAVSYRITKLKSGGKLPDDLEIIKADRRKWTKEEDRKVAKLLRKQSALKKLSKEFGRTTANLKHRYYVLTGERMGKCQTLIEEYAQQIIDYLYPEGAVKDKALAVQQPVKEFHAVSIDGVPIPKFGGSVEHDPEFIGIEEPAGEELDAEFSESLRLSNNTTFTCKLRGHISLEEAVQIIATPVVIAALSEDKLSMVLLTTVRDMNSIVCSNNEYYLVGEKGKALLSNCFFSPVDAAFKMSVPAKKEEI